MPPLNPDVVTVKKIYPECFPVKIEHEGKEHWEVLNPTYNVLGTGETASDAWKDAVENLDK